MSDELVSPWEELNRLKKAIRMANFLDAMGREDLDDDQWQLMGMLGGFAMPSPETRSLAKELLRERRIVKETIDNARRLVGLKDEED